MKRKLVFWFPVAYLVIIFINIAGVDDKNLMLFFTSPFMRITENYWFVVNFTHPSNIIPLIMILSLIIWFLVGLTLDLIIKKIKKD